MSIQEVAPKFKTSDGAVFASYSEAERHEELVQARRAYEDAIHELGKALGRTARTADGELFDFRFWGEYWRIWPEAWGSGRPALQQVDWMWGHPGFDFEARNGEVTIRDRTHSGNDRPRVVTISQLYAHYPSAQRALLAAQEEWLARQTEEIQKTRDEVAKLAPGQPTQR